MEPTSDKSRESQTATTQRRGVFRKIATLSTSIAFVLCFCFLNLHVEFKQLRGRLDDMTWKLGEAQTERDRYQADYNFAVNENDKIDSELYLKRRLFQDRERKRRSEANQ